MTALALHMREYDNLPSIAVVVETEDGVAVDLTGYRAYILMRRVDGDDPFTRGGPNPYWITETEILNAQQGIVTHDWQPDETIWPGVYLFAIHCISNATGRKFTAPTDGSSAVIVADGAVPPGVGGYGLLSYGSGRYGNPQAVGEHLK